MNDAHASLFNRGYIRTSCNGGNGAIEVADRILSLLRVHMKASTYIVKAGWRNYSF